MPELVIQNLQQRTLSIIPDISLLANLQQAHIDWMHACGGKGRCTTCKMQIIGQDEHTRLSGLSLYEERLRQQQRLASNERLACQSYLLAGTLYICVPRIYQLPHIHYDY